MKPKPTHNLLILLDKIYPEPKSELNFQNEYQLTVSVMLSAQCTDKKVNQVTPALFERYSDFKLLAKAKLRSIENIIRPVNYYKTKAKHLIGTAKLVVEKFGGQLPRTHTELKSLPGIGQKTANVIVSELGIAPALPVDTHVFRVSRRLGLSTGKTPEAVEEELKAQFESKAWRTLHHSLIFHGRRVCKAQSPMCQECGLKEICPSRK